MKSVAVIGSILFATALQAQSPALTGDRWRDMDYGPFLTASVECRPKSNIAHKGVAVPLRDPVTGIEAAVVFDTDLLRYAAGWIGGFIKLKGVVFDGVHGTYPEIDGEQIFGTLNVPGWADASGSFNDAREFPWGPLPRDHAHFNGLYDGEAVDGTKRVVFSYSVGKTQILDSPSLESMHEAPAFVRTLRIGPSAFDLVLEISDTTGMSVRLEDDSAILSGGERPPLAWRVRGDSAGVEWVHDGASHLRLRIPRADKLRHLKLTAWRPVADRQLASAEDQPPIDLEVFTRGHQRRWIQTLTTRGRLDIESDVERRIIRVEASAEPRTIELDRFAGHPEVTVVRSDSMAPAPDMIDSSDAVILAVAEARPLEVSDQQLAEDLLGYWRFNEGRGTMCANEIAGGAPVLLEGATFRRGLDDRSVEFNGTTRAAIDIAGRFDFLETDLAVSVWINTERDGTILSKGAPEGPWVPNGKTLFVRGGRLCYDVGWVGVVESESRVDDGSWHHVALTWNKDAGVATLWIDGERSGSKQLRPKDAVTGHVVRLGYTAPNFPGESWFSGKVDDLRIYTRRLTPEEIALLGRANERRPMRAMRVSGAPAGSRLSTRDEIPVLRVPGGDAVVLELLTWDGRSDQRAVAGQRLAARDGADHRPFVIDQITAPNDNPWHSWMRFGGFDFFTGDPTRAAVCTWSGDVWLIGGLDDDLAELSWQRIATGLYQPLGLRIVDDVIHVVGRDQITQLIDLNGDGETDFYKNFNNDTMNTEHFHEPCMDLHTDAKGNFYYMKGARHALRAQHPHHGTLMRVSADGSTSEIVAGGFRASNGLSIGPHGQLTGSDQEGYWMPANKVTMVVPGAFHGNGWGWLPDGIPETFHPPICWLHPEIDRSPSSQVWVDSENWGALNGALLGLSYGTGEVYRVPYENVNGLAQGAMTPLGVRIPTGAMRARFSSADGALYVCGLVGWSSDQPNAGGFYRVRRTAGPVFAPASVRARSEALELTFDTVLDRESATLKEHYTLLVWNYRWTDQYGSPRFRRDGGEGLETLTIAQAELSVDGRTVTLHVPDLSEVMQYHLEMTIEDAEGNAIDTFVHGTIHALPGE